MAERSSETERKRPAKQERPEADRDGERERETGGTRRISARRAAEHAVAYVDEMTGRRPEVVTVVEPSEQGWLVEVEVVELGRIPPSTDVLASYEVELDAGGEPIAYRRVRRYYRARVGDD